MTTLSHSDQVLDEQALYALVEEDPQFLNDVAAILSATRDRGIARQTIALLRRQRAAELRAMQAATR